MDEWSARDDGPYVRSGAASSSSSWLAAVLVVALFAAVAVYYRNFREPEPVQVPVPSASAPAPHATQADLPPARQHPLELPPPAPGLPTLDNSDSSVREALVGLIGGKAFADFVVPDLLIRRVVATVDNLPRRTAPRRMMPFNPVPGAFAIRRLGGGAAIDPSNHARYAPYVRVMDAVNPSALVEVYLRTYPLFQRAFEELGYPGRYFNDRLVAAIDDMLAAPEPSVTPALVQGRILYEFADPDFETRSAGQKIMLRIGGENALRVKAKLREIRRELDAARGRKPQ